MRFIVDIESFDPPWSAEEITAIINMRLMSLAGVYGVSIAQTEKYGRPGDTQPMPTLQAGGDIQSLVIADIGARREVGIQRYGTALQAHNGRDALADAYDEALDLACYLKQAIVERDLMRDEELL